MRTAGLEIGERVGEHFVAVTDPGSDMEKVAKSQNFKKIFYGVKQIGGRYSVLTNVGLLPAATVGPFLAGDAVCMVVRVGGVTDYGGLYEAADRQQRYRHTEPPPRDGGGAGR